jgi:hypothetical protein
MIKLTVSLAPGEVEDIIERAVEHSGLSVEKIDTHHSKAPDGREAILLVYDKYYMRNSSRASLSILIENVSGDTTVVAIGSGGSQGALINFDWGSAGNFESVVSKALRGYT